MIRPKQARYLTAFRWPLVFGAALFVASQISLPVDNLMTAVAADLSHVLLFGALAILLCRAFAAVTAIDGAWSSAVFAAAVAAALAAIVELAQLAGPRTGSTADWVRSCVGVLAGLTIYIALAPSFRATLGRHLRLRAAALAGAVVVLGSMLVPIAGVTLAYRERSEAFPVLFDGDRRWSDVFVRAHNAEFKRVPVAYKSQLRYTVGRLYIDSGEFAGIELLEPVPDWRGYEQLVLHLHLDSDEGRQLKLRIEDSRHDQSTSDRYQSGFHLDPGPNRVVIPLQDVRQAPASRAMQTEAISRVVIYDRAPASRYTLYLERIALN